MNTQHICILLFIFLLLTSNSIHAQNALHFDGTNDYVQTTYGGISGNAARTVEAWIKTDAISSPSQGGRQKVILGWGTFATGARFTFCTLWNNAIRLEVSGSGLSGTIAVNDTIWHHVAGVYDPTATTRFSLYVDGVLDTTANIPTPVFTGSTVDMRIGQRIDGVNPFDGEIDEVRVWNYARTPSQIRADMNSELCSPPGLVAYYKFNQGNAGGTNTGQTTLTDFSGNNNNGTLLNFALVGNASNWVTGATLTPSVGGTGNLTIATCDSYISPSGKLWTQSSIFSDTIQNAFGCDSFIQVDLTILQPTIDSISPTACDNYLSPSGKSFSNSGMYLDTLTNAVGCDSIIHIDLTINTQTSSTIAPTACESYTSPSGNFTWTASGTYQDIILNSKGCDSLILINLTISGSTTNNTLETACDSFRSPSGRYLWTNSGTYLDTLVNQQGCDSVLIIGLTINNTSSQTIDPISCGSYLSPSGNFLWTSSGSYQDTLTNTNGCPEYIMVNLTIVEPDTSVTQQGFTLSANAIGLGYQWLDCQNSFAPIPGATAQTFVPLVSGIYALEVTEQGCKDTSSCFSVLGVSISNGQFAEQIKLFPNPAQQFIKLDLRRTYAEVEVNIFDLQGQQVLVAAFSQTAICMLPLADLPQGMYAVSIKVGEKSAVVKLLIE